ncbi:MAG: C25 family cysteine peptidase, partial [Calditrichota bacterium]
MLRNKLNKLVMGIIIGIIPSVLSASPSAPDSRIITLSPIQTRFEETAVSARLTLDCSRFDINIENQSDTDTICFMLEGEMLAGSPGTPNLPVVARFILMPPTGGVSLRLTEMETHVISGFNVNVNDFNPERDEFWPPEPVRLGTPAILRGYRIIPIIAYPLRWNPVTRELQVVDHFEIELDYNSLENQFNQVVDPNRSKPSEAAYRLVRSLVVNPPEPLRDLGQRNGAIAYIIGPWDNVQEELQPLLEWRRRMGWTADIIRVAQSNSTAAVKNAIQQAYDEWDTPPEFVVLCGDTDGPFPIAFYDERRGAAYPYETDHHYAELEGDDILPEVAVGRLVFSTVNMLRDEVNKTISYESDPYIGANQARGWQRRAAVVASDFQSGTSSIDVCRWVKDLVVRNGYSNVAELYWTPQNPQPNARQFIMSNIDAGVSIFMYRGWAGMSGFAHADVDQLRNGRMLPFVLLPTCNTGDYAEHITSEFYYTERFVYLRNAGAIGAIGTSGATHTAYNNLFAAGTLLGLFEEGIVNQGWALMRGKLDLFRNYSGYGDIAHHENGGLLGWVCETYIFNLIGDPAVDLYTDVPRTLEVNHPASLRAGETRVQVEVVDPEEDVPLQDTRVCLYKSGVFQKTLLTDADGLAVFSLDPDWTVQGVIQLTVTGHNLMPYLRDLQIQQANQFVGAAGFAIDDDNAGDSRGNDDGIASPGERLELTIDVANLGSQAVQGAIDAALTTNQPHLDIVRGAVRLEAAPAVGRSTPAEFIVDIGGGFPHGSEAVFSLTVTSGQTNWTSSIAIQVVGPQIEFASLQWVNAALQPAGVADCHIRLRNTGGLPSPNLQARLISLTPTVSVPVPGSTYSWVGVNAERRSQTPFRLAANIFQIVGSSARLALIVTGDNGFVDTAWVNFSVGEPRSNQPFGPDRYGYLCIDNTDRDWFSAPNFNWVEIDPHYRGPGTDTQLRDTAEEEDASVLVNLPFEFRYYSEDFNRITVCSNGWLTMGDQHLMISGRNRRLGSGEVMPAMICPFWDDLLTTNQGGVYTWYDQANDLFIVEWSRMR